MACLSLLIVTLLVGCGGAEAPAMAALAIDGVTESAMKRNSKEAPTSPPGKSSPTEPPAGDATRWSDAATWGGQLPTAGAEVVIPVGRTVVLDTSPPGLAGLRIEGTLKFDRKDLQLTAGYIDVTGAMEIGTEAEPMAQRATITLTGQPDASTTGQPRSLQVRGGRLALYGAVPQPVWTKLNEHAGGGSRQLVLKDTVQGWRAGDLVAIAPTDWHGAGATERITVSSIQGNSVNLAADLIKPRWGKLQYVTTSGVALTPDPSYVPPAEPSPREIDQRAPVANLSRNIVIQGADDAVWRDSGFGAHVMVMNLESRVVIDGVEVRRAGQAGLMGRYPVHWHLLSYGTDGRLLGDATGHVIRNSSIWNSSQRCVVIHGTNGVLVRNNVCQDIKGHAFFLEDAVERRNVFEGNLALSIGLPMKGRQLLAHEGTGLYLMGPSGFWLTNPDNIVRGNQVGDSIGNGFWLAFPAKPLGLSKNVVMEPYKVPLAAFDDNTSMTTRVPGIFMDGVPMDDAGNIQLLHYSPQTSTGQRAALTESRNAVYKSMGGAYRNRGFGLSYAQWVAADNTDVYFSGSSAYGAITRSLIVARSLNSSTAAPVSGLPVAFATYHSSIDMSDNTLVGFGMAPGERGGAWDTVDYYLRAVDKGSVRNGNNRMIQSGGGYRYLSPNIDPAPQAGVIHALAGALWDSHGYWGPKGNYWVFDVPFLTAGANCRWVEPAGKNGKSCDGEYYGVGNFYTDFQPSMFTAALQVTRHDRSGNAIGQWNVADGAGNPMLPHMRHFAARNGDSYALRFPGQPLPRQFSAIIGNGYRDSDQFVFGISFDGAKTAVGYVMATVGNDDYPMRAYLAGQPYVASNTRWYSPAANLAEVAASAGDKMWQDRANNMVWIKHRGGMPYESFETNSDFDLYRDYKLVIFSKP